MGTFLAYVISPLLVATLYNLITKKHVNENKQTKKTFLIYCGIIISLMIGLRNKSVGPDTHIYWDNWTYMSQVDFTSLGKVINTIDFEIGYLFAVWIFSHVFSNPQFLFIISGVFFAFSICKFIYKNSEDVLLSMIIFNCFGLFIFLVQGLRQGIAICICLYALEFCKQRKLIPFLLTVILAMMFHASAIVFIVIYPLYKLSLEPKRLIVFIIIAFIGVLTLQYLFDVLNYFIKDDYNIDGTLDDESGFITILIYMAILLVAFLFNKTKTNRDNEYALCFYVTCIGMLSLIMRHSAATIVERVSYYFSFGQIILIPMIINNFRKREEQLFMKAIVILLFVILAIHKTTYSPLIPYLFFWQG